MTRKSEIANVLRSRLVRGLHARTLRNGDRLPSAREVASEFDTEHRVALDAYRVLVSEGLVELRARGGIYVAATRRENEIPLPSAGWLSALLTQAVARDIPLPEVHAWFRRVVETRRLRVVAIQETSDALVGLCRELKDDYGLDVTGVDAADIDSASPSHEIRYADLILTTAGFEALVRPLAERLGKPVILVRINPDLLVGEWRMLLRRPVYVVVGDQRFVDILRQFFIDTPGAENLRMLIAGTDDLSQIPDGAPTYVTRSAQPHLQGAVIRGRILPDARILSADSSRAIIDFIVTANLNALATRSSASVVNA